MATSSKLKTADGKYYATENYVNEQIAENLSAAVLSGNVINVAISDDISGKANASDVYTKEETDVQIVNFFTMNTL